MPYSCINRRQIILQLAKWLEITGQEEWEYIRELYSYTRMEKGLFHFARFLDHKMSDFRKEEKESSLTGVTTPSEGSHWDFVSETVTHYACTVWVGNNYVHSALPRLLTVWLDAEENAVMSLVCLPSCTKC